MRGAQFCRECGCRFPPKVGEGHCAWPRGVPFRGNRWLWCWLKWTCFLWWLAKSAEQLLMEARAEQSASVVLLPGLKRALEICEQCRCYYEIAGRPIKATHLWDVEVKLRAEIERCERSLLRDLG